MTNEIKNILIKYDLLDENIYEDNIDYKSTDNITDILIIIEDTDTDTQIKLLECANELNALDNDNLYVTYTRETDDYKFTYLTTFNAINEFS